MLPVSACSSSSSPLDDNKQQDVMEMDSHSTSWVTTKSSKRTRLSDSIENSEERSPVEISNRFAPLTIVGSDENKCKPPPIYVNNVPLSGYKKLIAEISSVAANEFECQASQNNGVTFYPRTADSYRAIVRHLKTIEMSFHSYQLPNEKPFRIVIRHLHPSTEPAEITEALTMLSFKVRNVVNVLQAGTRTPLPLFFVDLEPSQDNNKIFDVKTLLYTRIAVEEPRKKQEIVQCKRCLQFGHTRTYCNHAVKCARCGEGHPSSSCTLPATEPRKCTLCEGNHSSTYRGCKVYKDLRNKRYNNAVLNKANKLISNQQSLMKQSANPIAPVSTQTTHSHQPQPYGQFHKQQQQIKHHNPQQQHTQQQHIQQQQNTSSQSNPPSTTHDPRKHSPFYSHVLSKGKSAFQSTYSDTLPNTSANISNSLAQGNTNSQNFNTGTSTLFHSNESIAATLDTFMTRFHDLIAPLISTLTLLVNKLLSPNGRNP
jgi:hypothetical protein